MTIRYSPAGHFCARFFVCLLFAGSFLGFEVQADQAIYADSLQNSWQDWSWNTTRNFNNIGTYVHSGANSIGVTITNAWGALSLWHSAFDSSVYSNLTFWVNGGASGGQQLQIYAELTGVTKPSVTLPTLTANTWQQITLSLSSLGVANQPNFIRFSIQDHIGAAQPTFYVDDITLTAAPPTTTVTNAPVVITVNAQLNRHAISPQIYGTAFASASQLQDLNFTMNRSGGNAETSYN